MPGDTTIEKAIAPVEVEAAPRAKGPEEGIALCLSGGGYRAMVFHVGALLRLDELGYLKQLKRISSVSGGSLTAAVLALHWGADLDVVVKKIRAMAATTVDIKAGVGGILKPWSTIAEEVTEAFDEMLFQGATLQDLPDAPRFVINATNVESGVLWRFSKPYMGDWRVGRVESPRIKLAMAVAASAAFPPFLSPLKMRLDAASFIPGSGVDLQDEKYRREIELTDGGVYDNLGLETVWKRYRTVLVSDGGGKLAPDSDPADDWARHTKRVLDVIDNQVRSLRKRQLIGSFELPPSNPVHRFGTYWGIRTNIADYQLSNPLACPYERTTELATIGTRLSELKPATQDRLINWGYAVCDAAMRRHVDSGLPPPSGFPYSGGV